MPNKDLLNNVKKLRELTGVGFKDCKIAIEENNGDIEKSVEFLSGIASETPKDSLSNMDEKDFGIGAQILHQLNIQKLALLSNSDQIKRVGLAGYGLEIVEYVGY